MPVSSVILGRVIAIGRVGAIGRVAGERNPNCLYYQPSHIISSGKTVESGGRRRVKE
jgi:hypothetical protein